MAVRITGVAVHDVRFPTSRTLDGSDAMNPDPDYSAAYVVLATDRADGIAGHGLTFTVGRGTEIVVLAVRALAHHVVGLTVEQLVADMAGFWRGLVHETQLRWLGPEKGVVHLAGGAVVNAVWDLWARLEGKPLWKLLADMTPEQLVACVDFRYIDDALAPQEALELLRGRLATRRDRETRVLRDGFPAYTTSAGWLGYAEETLPARARAALAQGFTHIKLKVGADLDADLRRGRAVREVLGEGGKLMLDANHAWGVEAAVAAKGRLRE